MLILGMSIDKQDRRRLLSSVHPCSSVVPFLRVLCDLRGETSPPRTRLFHLRPSAFIRGCLPLQIAEACPSVPSVPLRCQFVLCLAADSGPPTAIPSFIHHGDTEDTEENEC